MTEASLKAGSARRLPAVDVAAVAPFAALLALLVLGAAVNPSFLSVENLTNVLTRSAFIAVIGVGATFVIAAGGLDLSVGSMAAFVASVMILFMNAGWGDGGVGTIAAGMLLALGVGTACGLGNGLVTTVGPHRALHHHARNHGDLRGLTVWLAGGGSIAIKSQALRAAYRPVYFGTVFGAPVPRAGDRRYGDSRRLRAAADGLRAARRGGGFQRGSRAIFGHRGRSGPHRNLCHPGALRCRGRAGLCAAARRRHGNDRAAFGNCRPSRPS